MATKERLKDEWRNFIRRASAQQIEELRKAGIVDPTNDEDGELPDSHRYIDRYLDRGDKVADWLFSKIEKPAGSDPNMTFATAIAARIVDAFDCSVEPAVKLHCDCFRLALGYASCGSQKQVAVKHGKSKAFISFRVRVIQRRLGIPTGAHNGNRCKR